jgi:hypothetical protein
VAQPAATGLTDADRQAIIDGVSAATAGKLDQVVGNADAPGQGSQA